MQTSNMLAADAEIRQMLHYCETHSMTIACSILFETGHYEKHSIPFHAGVLRHACTFFSYADEQAIWGRRKNMNIFRMKKRTAAVAAAAMIMTTFIPMGEMTMADNQTEKKAVKIVQTAGRDQLGTFAPDFARYNDDILFGEVWSRNDVLSLHDRSIVTVSGLIGSGVIDSSLKYHIQTAKDHGVTKDEMVEIITQLGFYVGWPKAWAAFNMAKEVYAE